jgi:hypothetical protein
MCGIQSSCDSENATILNFPKSVGNFNSAYIHKTSLTTDPVELFIFNAKTEKNPDIQFLSVWIYQDRNYISGLVITKEKPFKSKK